MPAEHFGRFDGSDIERQEALRFKVNTGNGRLEWLFSRSELRVSLAGVHMEVWWGF